MFENPDFEGTPNGLLALSIFWAYNAIFDYSRVFGITWVNTSTDIRGPYSNASLNPDSFNLIMTMLCILPGLYISIKRCIKRVRAKKVTSKEAMVAYFKRLSVYGMALVLMIIFVPIITPYLRGWKSIF